MGHKHLLFMRFSIHLFEPLYVIAHAEVDLAPSGHLFISPQIILILKLRGQLLFRGYGKELIN